MLSPEHFDVKLTSCEVSAWGGLALLKKMMDSMGVFHAIQSWQLPMPGPNNQANFGLGVHENRGF
jgi:hypothetical protein